MSAVTLDLPDRNRLIQILAGIYQFRDGEALSRRRLLDMAGVGYILDNFGLSGAAVDVAWQIVKTLEQYGDLHEQPIYHALGALLSHLLTLRELPRDQAAEVARMIVKYSLVNDPNYIADLRAKHKINPPVARPIDLSRAAPPSTPVQDATPAFDVSPNAEKALEQIINSRDNFLDIYLLMGAIYSAQAVCKIEVPEGTNRGTGFLIGPNLLLTNQHVLKNKNALSGAIARFDYRKDPNGAIPAGRIFRFDPHFYESSPAEQLDYALVRLTDAPLKNVAPGSQLQALTLFDLVLKGQHRGYLLLSEDFIGGNDRINIIQHPNGDAMKVVLTQNRVVDDMTATRVQYLADTDYGSSGSPVFNQKWEVIALHHSGEPYPPQQSAGAGSATATRVNEGIPIRAIIADLRAKGLERELPDHS